MEAGPKVAKIKELMEKLGQTNEKAVRLKNKVTQLKGKVEEVRKAKFAEYKKLIGYQIAIGYAAVEFLAIKKIKIRRLIKKGS